MGRLILTNNQQNHKLMVKKFLEGGIKKNMHFSAGNFEVTSFRKITDLENKNSVRYSNGDFICICGTFIYNCKTGKDAIKEVYSSFSGDVTKLQNEILGNYSCVLKKDENIYIFTDRASIHKLYYSDVPGSIIVSQDLSKIAFVIKDKSINEMALLEVSFQYSNLDNHTMFNKIKLLRGNEYLIINVKKNSIKKVESVIEDKRIKVEENLIMVQELSKLIKKYTKIIADVFPNIKINMTGGLDSRLVLAAFLSVGKKPELVYGVGNEYLTNTKKEDLEINRILAKKFNLKLTVLDWTINKEPDINERYYLYNRYGQYSMLYHKKAIESYESFTEKQPVLFSGYGGETLRNLPWIEDYNGETFDINTFIKNYVYHNPSSFIKNDKEYIRYIKEEYRIIMESNGINPNKMKIDDFQQLHNFYRKSADLKFNNLINSISRCLNILFIPEISNYICRVPADYKKNAHFQLQIIHYLYPSLLDIPFFSHTHKVIFDKENMIIKQKVTLKTFAVRVVPEGFLKDILKHVNSFLMRLNGRNNILHKGIDDSLYSTIVKEIDTMQKKLNIDLIEPKVWIYLPAFKQYLGNLYLIYFSKIKDC